MSTAIALFEVERALALFAQGISGRPYRIQPDSEFTGRLERVPAAASHNRSTLYLPEEFDQFHDTAENLGGYRLLALHQLGYLEFGSHDFSVTEARLRCPELARRGQLSPNPRDSDLSQLFAHFDSAEVARALYRIIEAYRIDQQMLSRYPGIAPHYRRFARQEILARDLPVVDSLSSVFDALVNLALGAPLDQVSRVDVTGLIPQLAQLLFATGVASADVYVSSTALTHSYALLEVIVGEQTGHFEAPATPAMHGDPPLEWLQRERRLQQWQDELDVMQLDLDEMEALADLNTPDEPALAGPFDGSDEAAADLSEFADPPHAGVAMSSIMDDAASGGEASAGEQTGGSIRPDGLSVADRDRALEERRDALTRRLDMEKAAVRSALGEPEHAGPSFLYDEWDDPAQRYLRAWCRVFELPLTPGPDDDPAVLISNIAALRGAVRQRFEHLKPRAYARVPRVDDGDEFDWDQVVSYRVDRHRDGRPDDRVYQRRDRKARDVSALFLVDLSASTDDSLEPREPPRGPPNEPPNDPSNDREATIAASDSTAASPNLRDPFDDDPFLWSAEPESDDQPQRRRIIDVQREALLLMAEALDRLGDRFGVFGFSGYGRDCVEYYVAKEFSDAWNSRTLGALAAMRPRRSTRMGPAIRHSTAKLGRAGGALKVLIVISDGFPQDCDYGPDRGSHVYGVADTARALREAERAGITTFCITVDRSGHDYLKRMCDDSRYMVIEDIETLPDALSKVYEALTTA